MSTGDLCSDCHVGEGEMHERWCKYAPPTPRAVTERVMCPQCGHGISLSDLPDEAGHAPNCSNLRRYSEFLAALAKPHTPGHRETVAEMPALEGRKDDQAKPRMDLLPPELLEGVAKVLTFGAGKYGDRNWEKGMNWGRVYAALVRHALAFWGGEKTDPESGMPHTWHMGCCVAFLMTYEARGIGHDDRPL